MKHHNLWQDGDEQRLIHHTNGISEAEEATRQLLADPATRPTAIFCASDTLAMLVTRTARHMGLKLPEDLSIVGFANLHLAELADPPLTTVAQSFNQMGKTVIEQLMTAIESPDQSETNYPNIALPTELITRQSTAKSCR